MAVELDSNLEKGLNYFSDVGLVILGSVNKDSIIRAILRMDEKKYFETQKPFVITPSGDWAVVFE